MFSDKPWEEVLRESRELCERTKSLAPAATATAADPKIKI
jgi:hypothetical protein